MWIEGGVGGPPHPRALLLAVVVAAGQVVYCYSVTSIKAFADTTPGDTRTRPAVPQTGAARTALGACSGPCA